MLMKVITHSLVHRSEKSKRNPKIKTHQSAKINKFLFKNPKHTYLHCSGKSKNKSINNKKNLSRTQKHTSRGQVKCGDFNLKHLTISITT